MAPPSFRLDTLAANLIERLEPVRRAHLDDPAAARAAMESTTAEIAKNVAGECRGLLGDDAQATRIERESTGTFLPRYVRLALEQNRAERRAALTPSNLVLQRFLPLFAGMLAARVMMVLAPGPWDLAFNVLPFVALFWPEWLGVLARRRYQAELQALADDLGQLQDADERLAPTLPIPDRPTAAPNARAESTPNHAAASQRERS